MILWSQKDIYLFFHFITPSKLFTYIKVAKQCEVGNLRPGWKPHQAHMQTSAASHIIKTQL